LSGGGFRAATFHLGALIRLLELDILKTTDTFSSVSGGSVMNGLLAAAWPGLKKAKFSSEAFDLLVRKPTHKMIQEDFGIKTLFIDNMNPVTWISELANQETSSMRLARRYYKVINNIDCCIGIFRLKELSKQKY
jgi:NTE family protein